MKKHIFLLFVFCSMLGIAQNRISVSPSTPMDKAVSGHYAGWINGGLTTYGGCDFPDVPCADGGQKVYYPKAYGASVQVPGGVVYIGGMNSTTSLDECTFLNAIDGTTTPINALPKAIDNFAATFYDGMIWVAGGQTNNTPNKDVYALPFPGGKEWNIVATLPDECRLQPCVTVQNTAAGYALFIFGGYQPKSENLEAKVHTDGIYIPISELKKGNTTQAQWKRTSPALAWIDNTTDGKRKQHLQAIVGSTCCSVGYSHVLFFGGVVFESLRGGGGCQLDGA